VDLTLTRDKEKNPFAQTGVLTGLPIELFTLEDAWRGNARRISCIPTGTYEVVPHGWEANARLRFNRVWRLLKVPGRDAILFHTGNSHLDTNGCILVGFKRKTLPTGEPMLVQSRMAIDYMQRLIGPNKFTLRVV